MYQEVHVVFAVKEIAEDVPGCLGASQEAYLHHLL
jgi:hypothetical protein